jgi:hypothetical protein
MTQAYIIEIESRTAGIVARDARGYAIVSKADSHDEATLIPNSKTVVTSTDPKEFRYVPDGEWW